MQPNTKNKTNTNTMNTTNTMNPIDQNCIQCQWIEFDREFTISLIEARFKIYFFNILRFLWFASELQFEMICRTCILKLIFMPSELCRVPSVLVLRNSPFPFLHSNILISKCISLFKSLVMYYDTGADPAPRFLGSLLVWGSPKSSMSHAKRIDLY